MQYIAIKRYRRPERGERKAVNIPYGSTLEERDGNLYYRDIEVCSDHAYVMREHFARNDDGRGLERGRLAWAIAYGRRSVLNGDGRYYRLNDEERAMLRRRWPHFLREYEDVVLFNHAFFNAEQEELREIADALNIKVK